MSLAELMSTGLPLNRKEQFYTGTVLPMIACAHDFQHLAIFANLMGVQDLQVDASPGSANVQFFTEYAFAQSAVGPKAKKMFPAGFTSRETPDLLIYVEGKPRRLFAIEAKMYHRPLKEGLVDQIYRQKILLEHIRTSLLIGPGEVHHVALLPDSFAKEVGKLPVPVLTWESVLDAYEGIGSPYFLEVLRLALRSYEDLKSKKSAAFGANKDANVTGVEIHDRYLDGTLEYEFMGRQGGLGGKLMTKDIQSASWKTHPYEVRHSPLDKPNWFPVADFVALIEGPSRPTS